MNVKAIAFDERRYLAQLRRWVECESPTWDAAAVERMLDMIEADLADFDASVKRLPGRMGFGGSLLAHFKHADQGGPGILILGHADTVHPVGTLGKNPWRREGDINFGPGILDMKGGICLALEALRQIETLNLPVTLLITPDEEVGAPSSREIIETEAKRHRYVLVPEPARANNNVVSGRFAIARFDLQTVGRPSHAGQHLKQGRSAIREMARRIIEIDEMTSDDCTFSVGVVHGGQWVNCVATHCTAEALSMAKRQSDLDKGSAAILALAGERNGVQFEVRRGVTRPVWEPTPATLAMIETTRSVARELGFDVGHESAGGGSDGNFTGALGIPTLDGLGAKGSGMHTLDEQIEIGATVQRGKLFAGLLSRL